MSAFPDISPEAPTPHPVKVGVGSTACPSKGVFTAHPQPHSPHSHLPLQSVEVGTKGHRYSWGSPPWQGLRRSTSRFGMWGFSVPSMLRAFQGSRVPLGHPVGKGSAPSASSDSLGRIPIPVSTPAPASVLSLWQGTVAAPVIRPSCNAGTKGLRPEQASQTPNPGADSQASAPSTSSSPTRPLSATGELSDRGARPGRDPLPSAARVPARARLGTKCPWT